MGYASLKLHVASELSVQTQTISASNIQGKGCPLANLLLIPCHVSSPKLLLQTNLNTIVLLVPLPERCSINLDDGILHQSLRPDLEGFYANQLQCYLAGYTSMRTYLVHLIAIYYVHWQAGRFIAAAMLTSSLFDELYTTSKIRVFLVVACSTATG